jgi:2-oxoglutarate dehydrogenase E1 component
MAFLHNVSPEFLETQYRLWLQQPQHLPRDWQLFFEGFSQGLEVAAAGDDSELLRKNAAVQSLLYRYRDIGHLLACTDPLSPCPYSHPLLELQAFGLEESDLDRTFHHRRYMKPSATLRELLEVLQETYCRALGVEFMYIQEPQERQWLIDRMEPVRNRPSLSEAEKRQILQKLIEANLFENFLHRRFLGQKRFSLEGGEVLIPVLDRLIRRAAAQGIGDLVLGMAHRGRLNVLANIMGKPLENIFDEFKDEGEQGFAGEGDVKYHKGFSRDLELADGQRLHLTLASNPSHLEMVGPVVEGKCRARQDQIGQGGSKRVLPLLLHGDAAFPGQGVVAETLNLSQLEGYRTGGTVHLIINNQIGFTTVPADARSTCYATDLAKMLMVPIFHVHGEDPEAGIQAIDLALAWRQQFGRDVVVEIICYRRHGHNEGDEPFFTQPVMYEQIEQRPPVHELYAQRLLAEGRAEHLAENMAREYGARLEEALKSRRELADMVGFSGKWLGMERRFFFFEEQTGVAREELLRLARQLTTLPADFSPHPKIEKMLEKRLEAIVAGEGIDWGNAEALAFATLLAEGGSIRLSGQDSRRGTFNHRHAALFDQHSGKAFMPLAAVAAQGASCHIYDSSLSEMAVLAFEYGYSLENPTGLTVWEAQFGDFANAAQVIIDQFIVSSQSKWDRFSGVTLLLPHGYEGQGAEHSSGRIERFLQLCADSNIQVVYPSTPAQFFHLLRRQVRQPFRRPLVVFTPKSLLRHPACRSDLEGLAAGRFREILPEGEGGEGIGTVLLCSGKVYYDLAAAREAAGRRDVAIVRIEQLYPLKKEELARVLSVYQGAAFRWVQEEPANGGAWSFLRPQLAELLGQEAVYVGRPASAAPAVGSHRLHQREQERLLAEALA